MRVLISGASIAGPVLAYWLTHRGFDVTVVERAPKLRKTGGHAVDLFRPAMDISEQMGVLPQVMSHATGTTVLTVHRPWASRPAHIDYLKLIGAVSDRHVEIMRDDLSEIYYDASRDDVEYLFGNEITAISDDGDVTFREGPSRPSTSSWAPTACIREYAGSSSAKTFPNGSSAAICPSYRCRNLLPAKAKWAATSYLTGSR
jgi:2-polyprenyl-6-methoxyphenol hydroxylase-like FAD-dependent oxidoreductase